MKNKLQSPCYIEGCLMIPVASVRALRDISYNPAKRSVIRPFCPVCDFFHRFHFHLPVKRPRIPWRAYKLPPLNRCNFSTMWFTLYFVYYLSKHCELISPWIIKGGLWLHTYLPTSFIYDFKPARPQQFV